MTLTPKYEITEAENGQNSGEVTFNEAVHSLEIFAGLVIKSQGDTSPPGAPDNSDAYILGSAPSGLWSGFAQYDVAYYYDGWFAATPDADWEGVRAYVQDEDEDYLWDGSTWVAQQGAITGKLPITTVTTTYTMLVTDRVLKITGSNTFTLTLVGSNVFTGRMVMIIHAGSGTITIEGAGSETIDGALNKTLDAQYEKLVLFSDGTQWFVISRDGTIA